MQKIRVGFLGAGDIASIHKAALLRVPGVSITGVFDIDSARSARFAAETGARAFPHAQDLVQSSDVDAVYVLTPQKSHHEGATLALNAGKHTFIEKPVSLSKSEIAGMIHLAEKNSCLCVPGHNYIHAHELKLVKELIESNKLGEIRAMWILFMVSLPSEIRTRIPGPLREVMIHQFYSTLFLLGVPDMLFTAISDFDSRGVHNEDQAAIVCRMPGGALVNLFASFAADDLSCDPWTLKYKVVGALGSASHTWSLSRLSNRPQPVWDLPAYWETFREEDRYFIEECVRGGGQPLSTMQDAITCLEMLEAAEKSAQSGCMERVAHLSNERE